MIRIPGRIDRFAELDRLIVEGQPDDPSELYEPCGPEYLDIERCLPSDPDPLPELLIHRLIVRLTRREKAAAREADRVALKLAMDRERRRAGSNQ